MVFKNSQVLNILEQKVLPFVTKPGRYVGSEFNIVNKDISDVDVHLALAYPEVYEIGMSYVGFDILYHVLNRQEYIWAERVFAPWTDMAEIMRREDLPLYGLESFTPLREMDIVGFTLQYELTYTNVLNMLSLAGISIWAGERGEEEPLIIGGGPCTCNPEPMAAFFDLILIGDGEEAIVEICESLRAARREGMSRKDILRRMTGIRGVYVPQFYQDHYHPDGTFRELIAEPGIPEQVQTRIVSELKPEFYPQKPVVPLIEVTHDRLSVEVMRGCSEGCRYCNAGMIYRPVRERSGTDIVSQMKENLQQTGYDEVSFLSLSISDYSELAELMQQSRTALNGKTVNVSFPSMRLDSFSEEIARFLSEVRKSGFTFAPEAGSERLRRVINKNISEDDLFNSVRIALKNGWKVLKFYFMIGLPTEKEEDVLAIADLIERAVQISRPHGKAHFHVSVSPFSPKAHTPFQWEAQDTKEQFLRKINLLRNRFSRMSRVKFNWRDPEVSQLECILGRADRRMAQAIFQAWQEGAVYDGWDEHFKPQVWQQSVAASGLNAEHISGALEEHLTLPWDHIDKGLTKTFLLKERNRAHDEIITEDCREGKCHACGIQRKGSFREFAECYLDAQKNQFASLTEAATEDRQELQPEQVESSKYRLRYQKKDLARFLSHLDMVRIFERACRKGRIPLAYSQGFNPHPKFAFSPPLSLGFTSEDEYLDVEVARSYDQDLVDTLNRFLPSGIEVVDIRPINGKTTSLAALINCAEYEVDLAGTELNRDRFEDALNEMLQAQKIEVRRQVKGKLKVVDIRPYIETITHTDRRLHIKTRTIENRTVRIGEVLDALLPQPENAKVHRRKQFVKQGNVELSPFDMLS